MRGGFIASGMINDCLIWFDHRGKTEQCDPVCNGKVGQILNVSW